MNKETMGEFLISLDIQNVEMFMNEAKKQDYINLGIQYSSSVKDKIRELEGLKNQNADLIELVEEYKRYLILEHKRNSVPQYDPEKSNFFMQLDEKLKDITGWGCEEFR